MCGLIHSARRGAMTSNSVPKSLCRMYGNLLDSQDREPRHLLMWEPQPPDCGPWPVDDAVFNSSICFRMTTYGGRCLVPPALVQELGDWIGFP